MKKCSLLVKMLQETLWTPEGQPLLFISRKRMSLPKVSEKIMKLQHDKLIFFLLEVSAKPPALQLLLLIPEAIDVSIFSPSPSSHSPSDHSLSLPNCYLICKLFCAKPHPQTPVQWASSNPQFGIKQVCMIIYAYTSSCVCHQAHHLYKLMVVS